MKRAKVVLLACMVGICLIAASFAGVSAAVKPAGFPETPISFVVPFGFGGGFDTFARALCIPARKTVGQQINVVNVGGAGTVKGLIYANDQPADGYTLMGYEASEIIAEVSGKTNLTITEDFVPVMRSVITPCMIFVRKESPFKTWNDLIKYAKKNPGKLICGGTDAGGLFTVAATAIFKNAGVDVKYLSFADDSSRMQTSVLGGHVDCVFDVVSVFAGLVDAGKMRALVVNTPQRMKAYPKVPTLKELKIDTNVPTHWRGIGVKKGTPPERIKFLHDAFYEALQSSVFKAVCADTYMDPVAGYLNGEDFAEFINKERQTYQTTLKDLGFIK